LLDNKHVQDIVFQLKRLMAGLSKFHQVNTCCGWAAAWQSWLMRPSITFQKTTAVAWITLEEGLHSYLGAGAKTSLGVCLT
jgi:hypothetical protein